MPIIELLENYSPNDTTVIHGGGRGADTLAGIAARLGGFHVQVFYANWDRFGLAAGPIRNRKMLLEGKPTEVHAFHGDLASSKGTSNMIGLAHKAGIPVTIHTGVEKEGDQ